MQRDEPGMCCIDIWRIIFIPPPHSTHQWSDVVVGVDIKNFPPSPVSNWSATVYTHVESCMVCERSENEKWDTTETTRPGDDLWPTLQWEEGWSGRDGGWKDGVRKTGRGRNKDQMITEPGEGKFLLLSIASPLPLSSCYYFCYTVHVVSCFTRGVNRGKGL